MGPVEALASGSLETVMLTRARLASPEKDTENGPSLLPEFLFSRLSVFPAIVRKAAVGLIGMMEPPPTQSSW